MRFTSAALLCSAASYVAAAPFSFPLKNGFPNPSPKEIAMIESVAGGPLPNGGLPTKFSASGITALQLIAFNEIFEVAFFTELVQNITTAKPGFKDLGKYKKHAAEIVFAIRAQEELHALGANSILKSLGQPEIKPCKYQFPVSTFEEAIALAATFTDVVLGTLPAAQQLFANDGGQEIGLIPLIGSVIAQEGEQTGSYRLIQDKVPSAAPFLTGGSPDFAFTAIQNFVVPGSCPSLKSINLKIFKPLTVEGKPTPKTKTVKYSVKGTVTAAKNSLVYLSGQNVPLVMSLKNVVTSHGSTTFEVDFPFSKFAHGLTIAALVSGTNGKFASPNDVAAKTIYGPGLIEVR